MSLVQGRLFLSGTRGKDYPSFIESQKWFYFRQMKIFLLFLWNFEIFFKWTKGGIVDVQALDIWQHRKWRFTKQVINCLFCKSVEENWLFVHKTDIKVTLEKFWVQFWSLFHEQDQPGYWHNVQFCQNGWRISLLYCIVVSLFFFSEAFGFFTIHVSVRLSDRSPCREEQKKFHQKFSPVGLEPKTWSLLQCSTNWARQESVGQEISEVSFVCFMHHFTCWTLFISWINRARLYKDHEDSSWQLNVDLA